MYNIFGYFVIFVDLPLILLYTFALKEKDFGNYRPINDSFLKMSKNVELLFSSKDIKQ